MSAASVLERPCFGQENAGSSLDGGQLVANLISHFLDRGGFGLRKSGLPLHANDFPFYGNAQVPVIRNTDSCTGAGTSTAMNHSAG